MNTFHFLIRKLLKERVSECFPIETVEMPDDIAPFQCYVCGLFRYVKKEKRAGCRKIAYVILKHILKGEVSKKDKEKLLKRFFNEKDVHISALIQEILAQVLAPQSWKVFKLVVIVDNREINKDAVIEGDLRMLRKDWLVSRLKDARAFPEIKALAGICGQIANMNAIPVLMAHLGTSNGLCDPDILSAINSITTRMEMSEKQVELIKNPETWQIKWNGSPAMFAVCIEMMWMAFKPDGEDKECPPEFAELFIREMGVQLHPYHSFAELKQSCNAKDEKTTVIEWLVEGEEPASVMEKFLYGSELSFCTDLDLADLTRDDVIESFRIKMLRRIKELSIN